MAYLTIVEKTRHSLVLKRSPSLRSWAVSFGIFCCIITAFIWLWGIHENQQWFLAYCLASLVFSLNSLDEWESCKFDKFKKTVTLRKNSIFGKLVNSVNQSVVLNMKNVCDVIVKSEDVKYAKTKVHRVCLLTLEGHEFGITDCGTSGNIREHEGVRDMISSFLKGQED